MPELRGVLQHPELHARYATEAKDDLAATSVVSLHEYQRNCRLQFLI